MTILANTLMLSRAMEARKNWHARHPFEAIDVRSLPPLDTKRITASSLKTGRVPAVEKGNLTGGAIEAAVRVIAG